MKRVRFSSMWLYVFLITGISLACKNSTIINSSPSVGTTPSGPAESQISRDTEGKPFSTATPRTAAYLGDAFQKGGYFLLALSVSDPAVSGYYLTPEPGNRIILVEMILGNISGEMLSTNPLYALVVDSNGSAYQSVPAGILDGLPALDLFPGEQTGGIIGFKIPEKAEAARLAYPINFFGDVFIEASLAPAPPDHTPVAVSLSPEVPSSRMGDVVKQFGCSLTVTKVEDPSIPPAHISIENGYRMVAIEVIVENVSKPEELFAGGSSVTLVGSDGFVYLSKYDGRDGRLEFAKLEIGETAKGWISFILPENTAPLYLKYQTDIFAGNYLFAGLS